MTKFLKTLLLSAALIVSTLGIAEAQRAPCGQRATMLLFLAQQFDEAPKAIGLDSGGRVMEIVVAETGTWSILVTEPTGRSCLVASGTAFSILPEPQTVSDDPVS